MVEDARYPDQLIAYIHLNPVVAGLVDDPAQHTFCGHRELLGKVTKPLIDVESVLGLFRRYGSKSASSLRAFFERSEAS